MEAHDENRERRNEQWNMIHDRFVAVNQPTRKANIFNSLCCIDNGNADPRDSFKSKWHAIIWVGDFNSRTNPPVEEKEDKRIMIKNNLMKTELEKLR